MDRALAYEARGRVFESPRAYHPFNNLAFRLASWAPFGLHPAAVTGLWWPRGKANPKPPGRKAGRAYGRRACRPLPPRVDEAFHVPLPARCPHCGGGVEVEHTAPQSQEEIVRRTVARRFDIAVGRCRRCGRRVQGRHPLQTSDAVGVGSVQLGPESRSGTGLPAVDLAGLEDEAPRRLDRVERRATTTPLASPQPPIHSVSYEGWSDEQRQRHLQGIVNNGRFL